MFISKYKLKRLLRNVASLERDVERLERESISQHKRTSDLKVDIHGVEKIYTMFPNPGLMGSVRYMQESIATHRDNLALLIDHLGLEFIDLKAKRIIVKGEQFVDEEIE